MAFKRLTLAVIDRKIGKEILMDSRGAGGRKLFFF